MASLTLLFNLNPGLCRMTRSFGKIHGFLIDFRLRGQLEQSR
jgi:hypothetical protein